MKKRLAILVPAALAAALLVAAADDSFVGAWKLNVAKSKISPGPAPKSETVTIEPGGKVSVEEVTADGKTIAWGYTVSGDTPAPITGMENSSVVEKRIDDRTVEHTWKMGEATLNGRGVLSKNGKVMTYTMTGTNSKGEPVHEVMIFHKH